MRGERLERERFRLQQRVARRHHHAAVPLVARQRHQLRMIGDRLGGDREVRLAGDHLLADLGRVALVDQQPHAGIAALERRDRLGQRVARLGVGGGDGQGAELFVRELGARALEVGGLGQHALGDLDHRLARLGKRGQALAAALEHRDAELVLERADLLRHARLRGVQRLRGLGHVEAAPGDFHQVAQLLELHAGELYKSKYL